jgi:hypothetical protein
MRVLFLLLLLLLPLPLSVHAEDLGQLSANPYNPDSTSNPFGAGSPFKPDGLNNPFSPYGQFLQQSIGDESLCDGCPATPCSSVWSFWFI